MKQITSLQNPLVKDAASLQQKKYRDELNAFLVEGEEPCLNAIQNGWECVALFASDTFMSSSGLTRGSSLSEIPAFVGMTDKIMSVTSEILEKISKKDNPQDVIGVFRKRVFDTPSQADFYLGLEEIRDPGNLGTIMRTAHAVNVKNIILIGECCDPFNPEVIRASMGSFSAIHLSAMPHDEFVAWQKKNKLTLIGTDVVEAVDYRKADYAHSVLVMGNEQKGLSAELKKYCTMRVKIPMPGGTESLNLSIATGLLLYQKLKA